MSYYYYLIRKYIVKYIPKNWEKKTIMLHLKIGKYKFMKLNENN